MANDESIFREVDQELDEEKLWRRIRSNGPIVLAMAVLLVIGVGAYQFMGTQKRSASEAASREYNDLQKAMAETPEDADAALELFIDNAPSGYKALARFQLAARKASNSDRLGALAEYRAIYGDGGVGDRLRDLARIRAAYLSMEDGRDAVLADIGELENDTTRLGYYAREVVGMAALQAGDYQSAEVIFQRFLTDLVTPPQLRARAEELAALAAAGKAGVAIEWPETAGKTGVESFIDALDESGGGLGDILNDAAAVGTTDAAPLSEETEAAPPSTETDGVDQAADESEAPQNEGSE